MSIPVKTLVSGFSLPVLGLGTWRFGGDYTRSTIADEREVAAIRHALELGITHIDTAEMYGEGHSEELVGRAIQGMDRSRLQITSKVWPNHLRRDDLLCFAESSLRRLQTDYLDLYLLHWPNPAVPIAETMGAMSELLDRGLIRAIGVSNFSKEQLAEAQVACRHAIVTDQFQYNLLYRNAERTGLLEHCQAHDVLLTAWRPIKDVVGTASPAQAFLRLAKKYGKTPAQLCINWLISQPNVVTLSKMTSAEHLEENLGAIGWTMERDDVELLRREYPGQVDGARQPPVP